MLTRLHSSRMRTARSLTVSRSIQGGWFCPPSHGCRPPWMRTPSPLDADPHSSPSWMQTHPPVGRQTTCENITFANFVCRRWLIKLEHFHFFSQIFKSWPTIFTARQVSCGKVMFSVMSICQSGILPTGRAIPCDHYPWCIGPHCIGSPPTGSCPY